MDRIETKYPGPGTYKAPYGCDNCGWSGNKEFEKGRTAPPTMVCPKCGCATAKKSIALPYVPKLRPRPLPTPEPDDPWWPVPMPRPWRRPEPRPWRRPWDPWNPERRIYGETEERCGSRCRWYDPRQMH